MTATVGLGGLTHGHHAEAVIDLFGRQFAQGGQGIRTRALNTVLFRKIDTKRFG